MNKAEESVKQGAKESDSRRARGGSAEAVFNEVTTTLMLSQGRTPSHNRGGQRVLNSAAMLQLQHAAGNRVVAQRFGAQCKESLVHDVVVDADCGGSRFERHLKAQTVRSRGIDIGIHTEATMSAAQTHTGLATRPQTLQRHSSFEHSLMGNANPRDIATGGQRNRRHLLEGERDRAVYFSKEPYRVPTSEYPFEGVQLIRLTKSQLYVTEGEITALADYLPNGEEINKLDAKHLLKILQYVRHEIAVNCTQLLRSHDLRKAETNSAETVDARDWEGAQAEEGEHPIIDQSSAAQKVLIEEQATAEEGAQSYTGLLTRNACHFAPMSWERYTLQHNKAVALARLAWSKGRALGQESDPSRKAQLTQEQADARTQARVDGAYANHFLQDSFGAGHLVNKTLIIQWFLDWAQQVGILGTTTLGLPNNDLGMTVTEQPNIAGEALYSEMAKSGSVLDASGKPVAVDPQTSSESGGTWPSGAQSVGLDTASGDARQTTHNYWEMLRFAALNYAAGHVHDIYNDEGLLVKNRRGDTMFVGGDSEQVQIAGAKGFTIPIEATIMSRRAIDDALDKGQPSKSAEDCLALVPINVILGEREVPLLEWNEKDLFERCITDIFPKMWASDEFTELRRYLSTHADTTPSPGWMATKASGFPLAP